MQVDDVGGVLLPDAAAPVRLTLPADVGILGVNPNTCPDWVVFYRFGIGWIAWWLAAKPPAY